MDRTLLLPSNTTALPLSVGGREDETPAPTPRKSDYRKVRDARIAVSENPVYQELTLLFSLIAFPIQEFPNLLRIRKRPSSVFKSQLLRLSLAPRFST